MAIESMSYSGKDVYVGIDVHKKTYSLTGVCVGHNPRSVSLSASPEGLIAGLNRWFPGARIHTVYEAGFSGYVLHRKLEAAGFKSQLVHAAALPVAANDKVKTDRRDSKKMAQELAAGRIKGIYIPSPDEEASRLLHRTRSQVVEARATLARQIKSKLYQFQLIPHDENRAISARYIRTVLERPMPEELRLCLEIMRDTWRFHTLQLLKFRKLLKAQARTQERLEAIYRSVPGVGEVVARILATELGDMSRFPNERALSSYSGLTPCEYSSGSAVRRGHITRQGSAILRGVLVESAWRATNFDPALKEIFNRIAHRRGKKKAIVAIARRMLGRMRACFRQNSPYVVGTYA